MEIHWELLHSQFSIGNVLHCAPPPRQWRSVGTSLSTRSISLTDVSLPEDPLQDDVVFTLSIPWILDFLAFDPLALDTQLPNIRSFYLGYPSSTTFKPPTFHTHPP